MTTTADLGTDLAALLCLDDVALAARRVLPEPVWDYVAGGSGTESTLRDNRDAFDRVHLVPRVLAGSASCDLGTEVLGTPMGLPVGVAPMAAKGLPTMAPAP